MVKSLIPSNFLPSFSHFLKVEEDIKVKLYLERIKIEQRNNLFVQLMCLPLLTQHSILILFHHGWKTSISKDLENSD